MKNKIEKKYNKTDQKIYKRFSNIEKASNYAKQFDNVDLACISKEIGNDQKKKFLICNYQDFFNTFNDYKIYGNTIPPVSSKHRVYHEVLSNNKEIKIIFDFESLLEHNSHLNEEYLNKYVYNGFLKYICLLLNEEFELDLNYETDFKFLTATSTEKFSYHVICTRDDILFQNKYSLYNFVKYAYSKFKKDLEEKNDFSLTIKKLNGDNLIDGDILDLSACKGGSMRILGSIKKKDAENENRRFYEFDIKNKIKKSFTIQSLKETLVHYINYGRENIYSIEYGDKIINEKQYFKKEDNQVGYHEINFKSFDFLLVEIINNNIKSINQKYKKNFNLIQKITTVKESNTKDFLIICVKEKCVISCYFKNENHKSKSNETFNFLINLKKMEVYPKCFSDYCVNMHDKAYKYLKTNLSYDETQRILIMLNEQLEMNEKINKIKNYNSKGKINSIMEKHTITANDL